MITRFINRYLQSSTLRTLYTHKQTRSISTSTNRELFCYTSGRFLYNEDIRLRERYTKFDPTALLREAERHIGTSHGQATCIAKLAEGGFNRVFLLTMEDGFQTIVKIPYPLTVPKHYATASEAATLYYLHSKGIPVPRMYGYSSSENNPAGVEYIVMEKAPGVGLETKWSSMSKRELHKLASTFIEIEKIFFNIPFGATGSIYFKKDVPPELQASLYMPNIDNDAEHETLCIGPTADYMFWYGKRAGLDLYCGPWIDPKEYLVSIAEKEVKWTRRYGKAMELDFPHNGVFPGKKSPEDYLYLLDKYLALAPYLLPKGTTSALNQPTLRHPDLNPNNIFISPDSGAISCIVDWQHTTIEPRLLVASYPRAFESPVSEESSNLKEPSLPLEYETLTGKEKAEADELYKRRLLSYYYCIFNGHFNKPHLEALRDPILLPRQHLVDRAGRQWSGNLMTLKGALLRMIDYWPYLPDTKGVSCPVQFTESEVTGFNEEEQLWFDLNKVVNLWRDEIGGASEDGWINNEQYNDSIRKLAELKASLIANAEGDHDDIRLLERGWLFRDREEIV